MVAKEEFSRHKILIHIDRQKVEAGTERFEMAADVCGLSNGATTTTTSSTTSSSSDLTCCLSLSTSD